MPKSHVRKKKVYTPPVDMRPVQATSAKKPSPVWLPVTAVVLIVLGIAWLVVFYLSGGALPTHLGYWNLAIGFGGMVSALILLSKWR